MRITSMRDSHVTRMRSCVEMACFSVAILALGALPLRADPLHGLDGRIDRSLQEWQVPGLSLAIVKHDKVIRAQGYGVRRFGRPEKVDERTRFAIGSLTKAFAAATIAALVGDGLLLWNDPVKQFTPWLEVYDPDVARKVTLRDMLSGTIGTSYLDENQLRPYASSARDILERGQFIRPRSDFRSGFVYSNNMFIAAGQVVATVSGRPWPQFARERLWDPLRMIDTGASAADAWASGNAASGHSGEIGQPPQPSASYAYCDAVCVPSGGINSNAQDMAQWLRFQLGNGTFEGKVLINRDAFREMHEPQTIMRIVKHATGLYVPFPEGDLAQWGARSPSYGFGWGIFEYHGRKILWHSGGANETSSIIMLVPEESLGLFISTNRVGAGLKEALALQLVDSYLGGTSEDWNARFLREARKSLEPNESAH